ncbi:hypothetical protein GCM10012287_10020 [Streptomyces daqingensis]|uniref:Uncharacterized protein n=1 Tax=Streptomyces daqingensis TaxID=1472640 RepID=A0ABQ2LYJ8_9ACTN|nr:hypothetical protein GCM10012287_10020 [Streptomyces daqingensis]
MPGTGASLNSVTALGEGGVRGAVALARQHVAEPGADGAGLVDRVQVTLFSVVTGQTGDHPIFQGAVDFDT